MTAKEIAAALRCTSTIGSVCKKEACPYWENARQEEIDEFIKNTFGKCSRERAADLFSGCDGNKICLDAAEILEELE